MSSTAPWQRQLARPLAVLAILGLILALIGHGAARNAGAAVGQIITIPDSGDAKQASVSEYPPTGQLYAFWSEIASDDSFTLHLAQSNAPDGSSWGPRQTFSDAGRKPNRPRIQAAADNRLHAVWNDDAFQGGIYHAWFTPGPGKVPTNLNQWDQQSVSGDGKNVSFDTDSAGNVYIVWDNGDNVLGRRWNAADASQNPTVQFRQGARLPGVAATGDGVVHTIFIDRGFNQAIHAPLDANWKGVGNETELTRGRADITPQITKDSGNNVYMVWSEDGNGDGPWEIYYAARPAGGAVGPKEQVSVNFTSGDNTVNHNQPTIRLDATNTPWIAWEGGELGGRMRQVYERRRSSFGFPAYTDANSVCVSCGNGGAAGTPRFGHSAGGVIHLIFTQADDSGRQRVRYSLRSTGTGSPPAPALPTPTPNAATATAVAPTATASPRPASPTPTATPRPATPTPTPVPVNPAAPVPPIADGRHDHFGETGHNLGNAFREYWNTQGGLTRFGFPLTEEFMEQGEDGKMYVVQYFERARFEWHPENNPPFNILLARLGLRLRPADPPAQPLADTVYFAQTGHNLGGTFLAYWQANGGLAVFGFPTSEEFIETSPTNGRQYVVQYFERNRFEYHPENAGTQYEVLLGLLGRQQLVERGLLTPR
jgi:hypothetical protein